MMKRCFCSVILILMLAITFCSCQQKELAQPVFPLESEHVSAALQESGLTWDLSDEQSWFVGHSVYTLNNENKQMIANVSSASTDGARGLIVAFMFPDSEHINNFSSLNKEDWEKAFKFASLLYGGFKSTEQVFTSFSKDAVYDCNSEDKVIIWEKEIRNIHCIAKMAQVKSNPSEIVLTSLEFYNSKGLNYFDKQPLES